MDWHFMTKDLFKYELQLLANHLLRKQIIM